VTFPEAKKGRGLGDPSKSGLPEQSQAQRAVDQLVYLLRTTMIGISITPLQITQTFLN
jgi:hypothetical protein